MAERPLRLVVPPRWARRVVLGPVLLALGAAALVAGPPLLLVGWLVGLLVPAVRPPLRLLAVLLGYLVIDSAALLACLALWAASGFGRRLGTRRFLDAHYALMRWVLGSLVRIVRAVYRMRFEVQRPTERVAEPHRPVIVLSRHAGPGDSFLVVHQLLSTYHRRPRVVMKDALRLDPGLDVLAGRLPNAFIAPKPGADVEILARIGALAAGLGRDDAMLIFPEGANVTPRRRLRSIAYLERLRMLRQAAEARTLEHLMAPRPGGVFAATQAAPGADVVFVAHTGVREIGELAGIWRTVPVDRTVKARWWRVPREQVPRGREDQERWLYRWWGELDDWIAAQG